MFFSGMFTAGFCMWWLVLVLVWWVCVDCVVGLI